MAVGVHGVSGARGGAPLTRWLAVAAATLAVAGCSVPGPSDGASGEAPTTTSGPGRPTGTAPAAPAEVGDPVTTTLAGGETLTVTVDAVAVTTLCPGRANPSQAPDHGYFVVLDVTARLDPPGGDAPTEPTVLPISAEEFSVLAPDGTPQEIASTDASWACYQDAELLQPFLVEGQTGTGKVVLDARTPHGRVVLRPPGGESISWSF